MTPSDPTDYPTVDEPSRSVDVGSTKPTHQRAGPEIRSTGTEGETRLDLVEEQLEAHARPVQIGEVLIRKEVVTETRTIEVSVQREELVVERRAVERRPAEDYERLATDGLERSLASRFRSLQEGESIRVPLIEEEVTIQKRPVVYEEVLIGRRALAETQHVSGTVRREELRVARRGDIEVSHVRRVPAEDPTTANGSTTSA